MLRVVCARGRAASVVLLGCFLAATADARADEPPASSVRSEADAPFGAPGQWLINGSSSIGVSSTSYDSSSATDFSVAFAPGIDYFVARNLAFGVTLDLEYSNEKGYGADSSLVETTTTTLSGGVRAAYNIPLVGGLSLYPRVTLGVEGLRHQERLSSGGTLSIGVSPFGAANTNQVGPWMEIYLPLYLQVAPHFFLGGGPWISRDFGTVQGISQNGGQDTNIGAALLVGGTWGGEPPDSPTVAAASPPDVVLAKRPDNPAPARFGDAHGWVIDSEISAQAVSTTYTGVSSSAFSTNFEPSFDYFFADNVSIGAAPAVSYSKTTGIDSTTGITVTNANTGWAVEGRLGLVARFGQLVSLYARVGLVLGGKSYNETEGGSQNAETSAIVAVHAFVPLLVHPAPHFFVGFGPSLYAELDDTVSYPNGTSGGQNRQTSIGLGLVVGGWL